MAVPDAQVIARCPGYDSWGYGLRHLYAVHRGRTDARRMHDAYPSKPIVYMLGALDAGDDPSLSHRCMAEIQGRNRLERGMLFFDHLRAEYGPSIEIAQRVELVPGVGHSGRDILASAVGRRVVFGIVGTDASLR